MKRSLAIAAAVFSAMWIASTGVLLFFVANLAGVPALLIAFVTMDTAFLALLALFLVTNTAISSAPQLTDPYGDTTAGLLRNAVQLPDGRPYGRRAHDDAAVVHRLIDRLERDDDKRPAPATTPQWALNLAQEHEAAGDMFDAAETQEES